jgi:hypothetical protein
MIENMREYPRGFPISSTSFMPPEKVEKRLCCGCPPVPGVMVRMASGQGEESRNGDRNRNGSGTTSKQSEEARRMGKEIRRG